MLFVSHSIFRSEFFYILLVSFLLLLLLMVPAPILPLQVLRVLIGLAFVLLFPGYCLQVAAFPAQGDLEGKERLALSFGLSLVWLPLLALILDRMVWGITLWSVALSIACSVFLFAVIAIIRRSRLEGEAAFRPLQEFHPVASWKKQDRIYKKAYLMLGAVALFFFVTAATIIWMPKPAEKMTEFYMLGSSGKAESYPYMLEAGRAAEITFGIRNLERVPANYRIIALDSQGEIGQAGQFEIADGEAQEFLMTYTPLEIGEDVQITFILLRDGEAEPYRTLHMWTKVIAPNLE